MKHREIYKSLIERIRSGEFGPGAQLPTEVSLGKEFKVSRPTVARAMRDLQQEGLVERRAGDGTYVLDSNRGKSELSVGLLIPELGYGDVFDPICARLTRCAQSADIGVIWGDVGRREAGASRGRLDVSQDDAIAAAEMLVGRGVDGVFFAPLTSGRDNQAINARILKRLRDAGVAVVLLDRDIRPLPHRSDADLVSVDHAMGQYLATRMLIEAGHKRIAYFRWPGASDSIRRRLVGLHGCAGQFSEKGVSVFEVKGDPLDEQLVEGLIRDSRPDAIACENDLIASQLLQSLKRFGVHAPEDVSVVGFNDLEMAKYVGTPLTTVTQPCEQIGETAVEVMRRRIASPGSPPQAVLLTPTLAVRESSKTHA